MRVLHVIPTLFDENDRLIGGAERYALELARHMSEVVDTTLLSFGSQDRDFRKDRLRIRIVAGAWHVRGNVFNPVSVRVVPELLRADVVHCHQRHVLMSTLAALASRLTGRRVFATDLGGGGWDLSAYIATDHWFHGHLHISEFSKRVAGHESEPRARVIFTGVDTWKFSPDSSVPRTGGIIFVGRLLPHKGIDRAIEVLPPEIPMDVVGPPLETAYVQLLEQLAKGKRIAFHTNYGDAELVDAYRRARCVVLPSLYKDRYGHETSVPELLGQTLLEGMSCGIPAICTNVGGMPEAVVDGVTGFVVPPDDPTALRNALIEAYENTSRSTHMGEAARQRTVEHFSWAAVVKRCLDAYAGVTAQKPRAAA